MTTLLVGCDDERSLGGRHPPALVITCVTKMKFRIVDRMSTVELALTGRDPPHYWHRRST